MGERLTPTNFFSTMQELNKHHEDNSLLRFEQTSLKELGKLYPSILQNLGVYMEVTLDFPLEELKHRCHIPELSALFFEQPKPQIEFPDLYFNLKKSSIFKRFLEIGSTLKWDSNFGIIFPVKHRKTWIIHNLGSPNWTDVAFVLPSNNANNRDIRITTLKRFIEERIK